jgi:AcrR family transcriptional regulator
MAAAAHPPRVAQRDAARTQADLLAVATDEFARVGYFGARVDEIAARSATTKRMIYYYFTDKEGLYTAVLEKAYADIRSTEQTLDLAEHAPTEAIGLLVRFTFTYHDEHRHLARLVSAENSLDAPHLRHSRRQAGINLPIVALIEDVLSRGYANGEFVRSAKALDLHLMMSALALFRITNEPTIFATFGLDMHSQEYLEAQIELVTQMILSYLTTPAPEPTAPA